MSDTASYSGKTSILDMNGVMFDVGKADLEITDPSTRSWGGTIRLYDRSALATKSLTALVELEDGRRLKAQVGPKSGDDGKDMMRVKVVGIDEAAGF